MLRILLLKIEIYTEIYNNVTKICNIQYATYYYCKMDATTLFIINALQNNKDSNIINTISIIVIMFLVVRYKNNVLSFCENIVRKLFIKHNGFMIEGYTILAYGGVQTKFP